MNWKEKQQRHQLSTNCLTSVPMQKNQQKEKQIFYLAAVFVGLALVDRVVIAPVMRTSKELNEKIIEDLSRIVSLHPEQFEEGLRIEPSAVESFIASIEEKISDVRGGKSSMGQALTFALNMEESILEL